MDLFNLFGKLKEVQSKMQEVQQHLQNISVEAESGGGLVKATVNGTRRLVRLDIDPSLLSPSQAAVLQDLVVAAVNLAFEKVEAEAAQQLQATLKDSMPNIPGLDFLLNR